MLTATLDFKSALLEVDILILYATRNTTSIDKYATFNKVSLILLCTKFETFIENFLQEYSYEWCIKCKTDTINSILKEHLFEVLFDELTKSKRHNERRKEVIHKLEKLTSNASHDLNDFSSDPKFSYGKHGKKELVKLLNKFGFSEFHELQEKAGFYNSFNSITSIRNNIIHEDATPNLTHGNVKDFRNILEDFVLKIDLLGQSRIDLL